MTAAPHLDISRLSQLEQLTVLDRAEVEGYLNSLTPEQAKLLMWDWKFVGRPSQQAPVGEWWAWLIQAGRGFGKTRACAEWVRQRIYAGYKHIALVARTARDTREVMIDGDAGLMSVFPEHERPVYQPSRARILFHTGAIGHTYGADEPSLLRGPQHDTAWVDELATWQYVEAWDNLLLGLRIGNDPKVVIGTTPKPVRVMRDLVRTAGVVVTRGSTYENLANLAPMFRDRIVAKYEGTRLGRQELYGELLEDTIGALWTMSIIDKFRVTEYPPDITRVVVAVDPPASSDENTAAECGIVAVALAASGHLFVMEDASQHGRPNEWGTAALALRSKYRADRIVAESNNGGEMVGFVLATLDQYAPVQLVWASRGKQARAEPVSSLYERGLVHHLGNHAELEDQLTTWVPGVEKSPDRLDALVWAVYALVLQHEEGEMEVYDDQVRISPY